MDVKKQQEIILEYLADAYTGAKMLGDVDTALRLSRAIAAFKASLMKDIFTEEFKEKYYAQN